MKQIFFLMIISFFGCSSSSEAVYNTVAQTTPMYFPPIGMDVWETTTAQSLNWDISKQAGLLSFLQSKTFKIVYDFGRQKNCDGKLFQRAFCYPKLILGKCWKNIDSHNFWACRARRSVELGRARICQTWHRLDKCAGCKRKFDNQQPLANDDFGAG